MIIRGLGYLWAVAVTVGVLFVINAFYYPPHP